MNKSTTQSRRHSVIRILATLETQYELVQTLPFCRGWFSLCRATSALLLQLLTLVCFGM